MFSHWPIGNKLKLGLGLLAVSLVALFLSGIYGLYAYRGLVKSLSGRSTELPLANELSQNVADLRVTLSRAKERLDFLDDSMASLSQSGEPAADLVRDPQLRIISTEYSHQFQSFCDSLERYRQQLDSNQFRSGTEFNDDHHERKTLSEIDELKELIERKANPKAGQLTKGWLITEGPRLSGLGELRSKVDELHELAAELPSHLHERLRVLAGDVASQYRVAISVAWATAVVAGLLLVASAQLFRKWVSRPLKTLVEGSREVARKRKFDFRIRLETHDEMQELAEAMNEMTARFQETRDDLDRQVRERTKQVVRSEQLASVGFLAAGVAHEINNPLASIALCSESLESRLAEILRNGDATLLAEREVAQHYLEMIQKEAFRCKQITEKLLDFSRMGDSEKHSTDLRELVAGVIEMVRHLGRYQDKCIKLADGEPVIAQVNAQEMKQVILNLITNGLDSIDAGGTVTVSVASSESDVEIIVQDNGCGMTEEVIHHLFEPFFTRRRGGQGTGLGLSIAYRIIEEHRGQIVAASDGLGRGSRFTVTLPLEQSARTASRSQQAA